MTSWLARSIPAPWRPATLTAIKALHTAIFASVGWAIVVFAWDGVKQRPSRRAAVAVSVALGESLVYVSNNQVCPLTPLAEELGAERGSVADMFLPDWLGRQIPVISTTVLLLGVALHLRALFGRAARRQGAVRDIR
jgi:hypothetical protein